MKIYIEDSYEKISEKAALMVASRIIANPKSVLGLATGSTPIGMYKKLIDMYRKNIIDFSRITTFNLDEYYKLPKEDKGSYYYYMMQTFFNHINISKENIHIPNGMADDIEKECREYEKKIEKAGGIDIQVLGIGTNGHIGFNEPTENLNTKTSLIDLKENTIEDNSRFFEKKEDMPTKAISMGIASIMKAKRVVLLASGENKAQAIRDMTNGYINTNHPASILQAHRDCILIIDKDAAKLILCQGDVSGGRGF
ncbi:MAG TPA: glucosamine-6-phosphate deaminase [Clostridia bacterium]|nr:glucosamine-6-phosphate deaminase [Clostridia bacterium]